ncbi:actin-like protein 7B [Pontoporia blainvillei]|uniref:Actin-like protein 7B n=1 Tax=Pontoporia blainvillei TaxID=48723 RepID=A0ABX0S697_PONBL|nr:actin-like protein 7B [Pontoporia blainvillei]
MGTAQGDPGEASTLPGPEAGIRDTSSSTQLKMKPKKVHKIKALIIDLGSQYYLHGPRTAQHGGASEADLSAKIRHRGGLGLRPEHLGVHLPHGHEILPEEHAVLVSDPLLSPTSNREKYAELMFETFGIPAMHVTSQSLLSIYSYGKTFGLVVESGHGVSHVVHISEGDVLPGLTSHADYAGSDLTNYLLLNEAGHKFMDDHVHIIGHIKRKCCYSALKPVPGGSACGQ